VAYILMTGALRLLDKKDKKVSSDLSSEKTWKQ
jgi:hypothetical protein